MLEKTGEIHPLTYTLTNTTQDVVDLLCHKDPPLAPALLVAQQDPESFLQICFLSSQSHPVLFSGSITTWWQGSSVDFVELWEACAGSFLQL